MVNKDKFKIKFNEFQRLIQSWMDYESARQSDEPDSEMAQDVPEHTSYSQNSLDLQIQSQKERMKQLVQMKVEKHHEKIKEIFENYAEADQAQDAWEQLGLTEEQLKGNIV